MKKQIERRITDAKITVRKNDDGTVGVRGYAAVFDSESFGEVIKRGAFNRTIAQKDNVRFLINHEGTPLASTRAGTMTIGVDDTGEWFDIPSLDMLNPKAVEFASAVGRGDMYQCSFAGYFRDAPVVDGVREVREVEQVDISGVTFPWYEDAVMGLTGDRSLDKLLVSTRDAAATPVDLTPEQYARAMQSLRAAPPGETSYGDIAAQVYDAICDTLSIGGADVWLYIDDIGADWAVYSIWDGEDWDYYQIAYSIAADVVTLGTPFEVEVVTEYRPMTADEIAADDMGEKSTHTIAEARALLGLTVAA